MGVYAELINGGQAMFRREGNDPTAPRIEIRIGGDHQCANLVAQKRGKRCSELGVVAGFCDKKPSAKIRCRPFDIAYLIRRGRKIGVHESTEAIDGGHRLVQDGEPLLLHIVAQNRRSGDIATRSVEALHKTEFDRITAHIEDNRDRRGSFLGSMSRGIATGRRQHGYTSLYEFGGKLCQAAVVAARPSIFNVDVPAVDETTLA